MFNLIKILNGRINVSEPLMIDSNTTSETTFVAGQAVCYSAATITAGLLASGNVLTAASGSAKAEYIVTANTTTDGGKVPVILITPDMIFEVPLGDVAATNANAANRVAGMRVTLYTDSDADVGLKITDTAASARFATTTATTAADTVYTSTSATTENFGALIVDPQGAAAVGDKMLVRLA